ncbi:uncharacterized protein AAEQ78_017520 [Lycaon pictus]
MSAAARAGRGVSRPRGGGGGGPGEEGRQARRSRRKAAPASPRRNQLGSASSNALARAARAHPPPPAELAGPPGSRPARRYGPVHRVGGAALPGGAPAARREASADPGMPGLCSEGRICPRRPAGCGCSKDDEGGAAPAALETRGGQRVWNRTWYNFAAANSPLICAENHSRFRNTLASEHPFLAGGKLVKIPSTAELPNLEVRKLHRPSLKGNTRTVYLRTE